MEMILNKIKAYGICLYKKESNCTKILLCKSTLSKNRWGFLKGVQDDNETNEQTAIREFQEECGILVEKKYFEKFLHKKMKQKILVFI